VTLNLELIHDRFQDIDQSLQRLAQVKALSRDEFLADQDVLDITCYRLLVAIEAALQICFHVCAQQLKRTPREYAECFAVLGEAAVLSKELSQRLQRMARFRNMLVHVYWDIDYNRVYDILADLDDLRAFKQAIGALL
jgi:uncharacterized protein YutE (UPF0331/DUF86 family)